MLLGQNAITGVPVSLVYSYETGLATLTIRTSQGEVALSASGGVALSLMRRVTKRTTGISVQYDPHDPTTIVAFTTTP
ncbi:MAG TPA: hypothetical protein VNN10_11225 [Dehalococcoidia bacterium]|nr:hypothetical protein [Dehalococcoidia bacterium]